MAETTPSRRADYVLATILGACAAFLAASLGIASVDPTGLLGFVIAGPGRFFFSMLHLAAWWVPVYFLVLTTFALRRESITWASVILINLVHIPVLTVGALLRLLVPAAGDSAPLIAALERSFTTRGASLVLSLILAVEAILLMQVWRWLEARARDDADADDDTGDLWVAEADAGDTAGTADTADDATDAPAASPAIALPAPGTRDAPRWVLEDDVADGEAVDGEAVAAAAAVESALTVDDGPTDEEPAAPREPASVQETLAALRARMEAGLDDEFEPEPQLHPEPSPESSTETVVASASDSEPARDHEGPLPLIFGHRHTAESDGAPPLEDDTLDADDFDDAADFDGADDFDDTDDFDDANDFGDADDFDDANEPDDADEPNDEYEPDDEYEEIGAVVLDDSDDEEPLPEIVPDVAAEAPRRRPNGRRAYRIPIEGILTSYSDGRYWEIDDSTRDASEVLRVTLEEFGIKAEVTGIRKGPVITMFEILPAPGVKLAKITNLADNIALRLAASSVRIVAPIPGKHAVGIEIPNRERNLVSFAELLNDDEFFESDSAIPIALGKDIAGEAQIVDLAKTPHLLIAGATGSGKSVCVNSIICSVLYRRNPNEVKLILIDPKIVELKFYNDIPHLLTPVITDPKRAFQALQYLIYEMERRYSLLDSLGARDISGFNAKIKRKNLATEPLPYIVVIIDEFADLMATSGKELESTVARLAAMSRAVGIHLVLATQRPSTDVITGLIKANIPSRIAFMVASKVDSRIIIDSQGAEKLLGRGDMLYTSAADPFPVRMQGAFLTEDEVEHVVDEVKTFGEPDYIDDEIFIDEDEDDLDADTLEDPLMEKAIEVVTTSRKASASYLQRRLKVGYNRAARMVEEMERLGIVGPQNGSKPRDVIGSGV